MTTKIAIVYHSGYGHTARVAEAIAVGAQGAADDVTLIKAEAVTDADWATLDASDAIIFGAPTYMGGVSGPFKMFIDATSARWGKRAWQNKIAAGFTNSASYSGDKQSTLQQLVTLAMQHGMIWVGQNEMPPSFNDGEGPEQDKINRLGSFTGLMTQSNHTAPATAAPGDGDLETARLFGARVVATVKRFNA